MLVDVLARSPGMAENCFSSGVATELAMFSGLAPGSLTLTSNVGVSYLGSAEMGNCSQQAKPAMSVLIQNSIVAMGRWRQARVRVMADPWSRVRWLPRPRSR